MTDNIDRDGLATIASAQGEAALATGDTEAARARFAEAAAILEREIRGAPEDTAHLVRFLAATQLYKGGQYRKALALADTIVPAKLPAGTRKLLPAFIQDVQVRASPQYEDAIRERLQAMRSAKDYTGIIETLQEHPYVLAPVDLASLRTACREVLGK